MLNPLNFLSKFIKSSNDKELSRISKIVEKVNSFENKIPFEPPFVKSKGNGKFLLDLFAVNEQQGIDAGLLPENIIRSEECTFCSPMNYFSYRREGQTGRILTFIMLQSR